MMTNIRTSRRERRVRNSILHAVCVAASVMLASTAVTVMAGPSDDWPGRRAVGAVYTMTNASTGNEIVVFSRSADGAIAERARVATMGIGNDQALVSAGSLRLVGERFLVAANPGDSTVSVFRIRSGRDGSGQLELTDRKPSGGATPISIAARQDLIYVLNAGSVPPAISGFELSEHGRLQAIPGSIRSLPNANSKPTQIEISPKSEAVLVADPDSNTITTFGLDERTGVPSMVLVHTAHPGSGSTHMQSPWGLAFDTEGFVYSSEAAGSMPAASSVGVHKVSANDDEVSIHSAATSLPTEQTLATDVAITKNGRYAFIANLGSDTISAVRARKVADDRIDLQLVDADGVSARTGLSPVALALTHNDRFLYSLNSGEGSIGIYQVSKRDGRLLARQQVYGLPSSASGLVSR